ncbi:MAG: ABC transporter permease [Polyangia bacterium]
MLLFGMLTFLFASEATIRQLTAPGIHQRAFRIGTIDGLAWEAASFSKADTAKMAIVPGAHMAPYDGSRCSVDLSKPEDLKCGATVRAYVEIWAMNQSFTPAQLDAWEKVPNGALVTRGAATEHGWKVGDLVTLHYNKASFADPRNPLELVITAITEKYIDPSMVYFHQKYFDDHYNKSASYWVVWCLVDKPADRAGVMEAMEAKLKDMGHPYVMWPMEMSEQAILSGSQVLRESFRVAGAASFFVIVCVSVTLLIISIERRRQEFAALLAIGFPRRTLAASILFEGVFLVLPAALLGGLAVWLPFHTKALVFDPIFRVWIHGSDVAFAAFAGLAIGLGAALLPAIRVHRLDVLEALR